MQFAEFLRLYLLDLFGRIRRPAVRLCLYALVLPGTALPAEDAWNLFSRADDARLGAELEAWLRPRVTPVSDRKLERYLERLGDRLQQAAPTAHFPFSIQLIEAAEPFALAMPGGRVQLTTGMLATLENERQLAGLLAHVAAHAQLRHATRAASAAERFKAQAAIVVANESDKTLLQSLEDFGLSLQPGAPLMQHDPEQEAQADSEAGDWLDQAGYGSLAIAEAFDRLHAPASRPAARFLQQHPGNRGIRAPPPGDFKSRRPLASERRFASLQQQARQFQANEPGVDQMLAWTPPVKAPAVARNHERYIAGHYQFSYPQDWRPGTPGHDETIQVAPRGGLEQPAGTTPRLVIGLMAGTAALESTPLSGTEILLQRIEGLRPGLSPAPDQRGIVPRGEQTESILLEGISPLQGQRELVWGVSRKLHNRFFYLLMVVPEQQFPEYRAQFESILQSINFDGHPVSVGGMPAGQAGQMIRP